MYVVSRRRVKTRGKPWLSTQYCARAIHPGTAAAEHVHAGKDQYEAGAGQPLLPQQYAEQEYKALRALRENTHI